MKQLSPMSPLPCRGFVAALFMALPAQSLYAATYYVDVAAGDDARSAEEAQQPDAPWKTLTRALGEGTPLVYGDTLQIARGAYVSAGLAGGLESFPLMLIDGVEIRGSGQGTALYSEEGAAIFRASGALGEDTLLADLAVEAPESPAIEAAHDSPLSIAMHIEGVDFGNAGQVMHVVNPRVGPLLLSPTIEGSIFPLVGNGLSLQVNDFTGDIVVAPTLTDNTFNASAAAVNFSFNTVYGSLDVSPVVSANYVAARSQSYGAALVNIFGYGVSDFDISPVLEGNDLRGSNSGLSVSVYTPRDTDGGGVVSPTVRLNDVVGVGVLLSLSVTHYSSGVYTVDADVSDNELSGEGRALSSDLETRVGRVEGRYHVEGNVGEVGGTAPFVLVSPKAVAEGSVDLEIVAVANDVRGDGGLVRSSLYGKSPAQSTLAIEAHRNRLTGSGEGNFVEGILSAPEAGDYALILSASDNQVENVREGVSALVESPVGAEVSVASEVWGNTFIGGAGPLALAHYSGGSGSAVHTAISVHDNLVSRSMGGVLCELGEGSGSDSAAQIDVRDNTFSGNAEYGVKVSQGGVNGGSSELGVVVQGNTLSGGELGVDLSLAGLSTGHAVVASIDVEDNVISGCTGEGIGLTLEELSSGPTIDHTTTIAGNVIRGCGAGIRGVVQNGYSGVHITEDVTIASNQIDEARARGIEYRHRSLSGVAMDSGVRIVGNALSNLVEEGVWLELSDLLTEVGPVTGQVAWAAAGNTVASPGGHGVGLAYDAIEGLLGGLLAFELTGNTVSGAGGHGLILQGSASGAALNQSAEISGNVLLASQLKGLKIDLIRQSGVAASDINVADNVVRENRLGGIQLGTSGYQGGLDTRLSGNTVTDNAGDGVEIDADVLAEPTVKVDLGGGAMDSPGMNTLTGNRGYAVALRGSLDIGRSGAPGTQRVGAATLAAQNNWWGTTDEAAIAASVYSQDGGVDIDLSSPLDARPELGAHLDLTADLDEAEAVDVEPGDVVTLTASLSLDGDIGCAGARFDAAIPPGAELVDGSVEASAGAPLISDGVAVGLGWLGASAEATVVWQLRIPEDTECAALEVRGSLSCVQLGEVLSDDPAAPGAEDPTAIGLASFTYYIDADGDGQGDAQEAVSTCHTSAPEGLVEAAGDCDDQDPSVNTQATERCDGVDDDCDGQVDEGLAQTFIADGDGDGYGDAGDAISACEAPRGFLAPSASAGDDCDDSRSDIHPAAAEVCDRADNDCDGATDEGGLSTFYADADGDGHGDASESAEACGLVEGYVLSADDCDDGDASSYPGGPEVCDAIDNDCDGTVDEQGRELAYVDSDGDGFGDPASPLVGCLPDGGVALVAGDCDDGDAAVYPGAEERCDGGDDDCDGGVDEGLLSTWFADEDEDGFGAGSGAVLTCGPGAGLVDNAGDCDDGDAGVFPGAEERCDGGDDDCDGGVDEGLLSTWFVDEDGDGFGAGSGAVFSCEGGAGLVDNADDCADDDAEIHPAAEERCNDLDDDCDHRTDEGVLSTYYADADGDGYGDPLSSASACMASEGMVADASDCDDGDAAVNPDPGTPEVCNGIDDNCDGWVDDAPECAPTSTPGGTDAGGGGGCDSSGGGQTSWLALIALLPVLGLRRRPLTVGGRRPRV